MGSQPDARLAGLLRRLDQVQPGCGLGQRPWVAGGRDDVEVLDAVGHPSGRPRQFDPLGRGMLPERSDDLLTHAQRLVEHHPMRTFPFARGNQGGEDRLLGLGPEALQGLDALSFSGLSECLKRIDRKLVEQPPRALRPQPGHVHDLDQARGELGAQFDRGRDRALVGQRQHLLLDGVADSG